MAEAVPNGYTTGEMKKIAKKKRLNIVFGIAQKYQRKFYNSAVFVSSKGKVVVYQKVHLFDREKLFFKRGKSLKTIPCEGAKLGLLICFDWLYPEVSRVLSLQGAHVLCHPANLVLPYGQDGMKIRCVENGVFAVTANRIGTERRGTVELSFTGGSQIINPRGEVLATAGDRSESLKVVEIDISEAESKAITSNNNIFEDRVPRLYAPIGRQRK